MTLRVFGLMAIAALACTGREGNDVDGGRIPTAIKDAGAPDGVVGDDTPVGTCADRCLATLFSGATIHIAVDATSVYWTGDAVRRVPIGGGTVTTLASGGQPAGIAVDGTSVYWTDQADGTIRSAPLHGGNNTLLAAGQKTPMGIAVDGSNVYWTNLELPPGADTGTVMKVALRGGAAVPLVSGPSGADAIALDAANVYYVSAGSLMSIPLLGGTPTTLAANVTDLSFGTEIAVDGSSVYFARGNALMKISIVGGTETMLASGLNPLAVAVDSTSAYWTNLGIYDADGGYVAGSIMKVPLDGGPPIRLAEAYLPTDVVVDVSSVYWVSWSRLLKLTPK
jgi:hypothetical protein